MNFRYAIFYAIYMLLIVASGLLIFGLVQTSLPRDTIGLAQLGLLAAVVIAAGMAGYAWVMFAGRDLSRARLAQSTYPADVEDVPPTDPLPEPLAPIDALLRQEGFTLDAERRGLHSADGTPTVSWHYRNAGSTTYALIALSPNGRDAGMLLTTFFADETQLTTRLSRTIPKIVQPDYESHSVERPEELAKVHAGHVARLAAAHGKPLDLATFEAEHQIARKTYSQNMGYMFDAMWRRNLVWLYAVEGIGLLALVGGLVQLLAPAMSPIRGLTILVGGAALLATLTLTGLAGLRRSQRRRTE